MGKETTETVKMIDHALKILDILRAGSQKLGVNELAKMCSISPSTAFRILKTLEVNGWVYQCADKAYIIGEKISFVMEKDNLYLALKEVASFTMQRYTEQYGQAMNLIVRDGSHCYIIQQSRTKSLMDYVPPLYSELPFYACAGGKILLAQLPISLIDLILNSCEMTAYTPNTITNKEDFWKELRTVASQGYAFDDRESALNGSCIAVPVLDHEGSVVAALSFSGFVGIDNPDELLEYLPALQEASAEISKNLFQCWKK